MEIHFSVLLFVFPMEPQFSLPLPIAWVIKIQLLWTALETSVFSFLTTFLSLLTMIYSDLKAYKIRGVFAIAAKKRLYISLVRSQLTYCSVV